MEALQSKLGRLGFSPRSISINLASFINTHLPCLLRLPRQDQGYWLQCLRAFFHLFLPPSFLSFFPSFLPFFRTSFHQYLLKLLGKDYHFAD